MLSYGQNSTRNKGSIHISSSKVPVVEGMDMPEV